MNKRRRKLIRNISAIGALGLSGCLDRLNNSYDYNSNEQITVSISEIASNPIEHELNFNLNIEKQFANEDGPPTISISITNQDHTDIILKGPTREVFGGETDTKKELNLLRSDEWDETQVENKTCWSLENELPLSGTEYETYIPVNDERNVTLDILGNAHSNGCLPTGEYRFETDYSVLLPDDTGNKKISEFNWGFIIDIDMQDKL